MEQVNLPMGRINKLQQKINIQKWRLLEKIRKNKLALDKSDEELIFAVNLANKLINN